jgi:hypothetical protein
MSGDVQLLLLISGVHIFGFGAVAILMLPAIRDGWGTPPGSSDSDDDGGRGPKIPPIAPVTPSGGGLPLPDAVPARVRLRDHRRLGDHLPARERRPTREPVREPAREPSRSA